MPRDRICFKKCQQNSAFFSKINFKLQRVFLAYLLMCAVAFLSACGGGNGRGEEATAASSDSLTRSTRTANNIELSLEDTMMMSDLASTASGFPILENTTDLTLGNTMMVIDLASTASSFTIPENTLSFALFAFGDIHSSVAFKRLTNPVGENLLKRGSTLQRFREKKRAFRLSLWPSSTEFRPVRKNLDTIQIPIVPPQVDAMYRSNSFDTNNTQINPLVAPSRHQPSAGTWTFATSGQPITLKLVIRTGTVPTHRSTILHIQPFICTNNYLKRRDIPFVEETLKHLEPIYKKIDIHLKIDPIIECLDDKFRTVSGDFNDPTTAELVSMGAANRINLFFVQSFEEIVDSKFEWPNKIHSAPVVAIVPGVFGFKNRYNGILFTLEIMFRSWWPSEQHLRDSANAVARGIGHFLGLQLTSSWDYEERSVVFDLLTDTCNTPVYDSGNCRASNVMFWIYRESKERSFTPQQAYVLKHSPMAY